MTFLAPLALIAVPVALGAIVSGSGKSGSGKASSPTSASSTTTGTKASGTTTSSTPKTTTTTPAASGRKTYVVKVGDNLSTIADKTGVTLAKLQELNPAVDPHTMTAGQMIRLR